MLNCFSDQVSNILTDISCTVQLVPMNYNGFFGNFTAASGCFQLVPKYKLKVKLIKNKHPNIFVGNKSVSRKWEPRFMAKIYGQDHHLWPTLKFPFP